MLPRPQFRRQEGVVVDGWLWFLSRRCRTRKLDPDVQWVVCLVGRGADRVMHFEDGLGVHRQHVRGRGTCEMHGVPQGHSTHKTCPVVDLGSRLSGLLLVRCDEVGVLGRQVQVEVRVVDENTRAAGATCFGLPHQRRLERKQLIECEIWSYRTRMQRSWLACFPGFWTKQVPQS